MRTRTWAEDSPRMLQGNGTQHWRITTSMTTDFPSQEEYTGEHSFVASAIMLDRLPSLRVDVTGCTGTYSANTMGNLFQSEHLLETRITPGIEDDEAASSLPKVHGK